MTPMHMEKASTAVIGLGKTGLSCVRFLAARGVRVTVNDSRANPPGLDALRREFPDVPVLLNGFDSELLLNADCLVLSPGVSLSEPAIAAAIAKGIPVIGDIELFARHAKAPVAAITGSNGKSTVTTLLGGMAQRAGLAVRVGGNLGQPALDLLEDTEPDLYVLELSSFQLDTIFSLNAAAAVVLNVSPDHMDRYADLAAYTRSKQRVYQGDGAIIVNSDDAAVSAMVSPGRSAVRFSLATPAPHDFGLRQRGGESWLAKGEQLLLPAFDLRIRGSHNIANALAALALGDVLGLPLTAMLAALRDFPGLPHRSEWVAEQAGVSWFNDSKGTNVGATLAALQGQATAPGMAADGRIVLILGGDGKGADFTPLRAVVAQYARAVVLIGRDAPLIDAALAQAVPTMYASDMADAVRQSRVLAQPGDQVLLSPACASFDMYSGYEERGRVFRAAVQTCLAACPATPPSRAAAVRLAAGSRS